MPRALFACCAGLGLALAASAPAAPPDFARDIAPFVQQHCAACHNAKDKKADLDLAAYRDVAALVRGRSHWESVVTMVEAGEMPPQDRPQPTAEQRLAFLKSVADLFDHADRTAPRDPGRVTVRRLNRTEYNHTVQDLVGIDFNPAEDFPSDDVGHGFDNIGDVLTLSPVLMERYLAAAESIMQRAIVVKPPPPPTRALSAKYLEPGGAKAPQTRFRPFSPKETDPIFTGPLRTSYPNLPEGDYNFRVRIYAEADGDQPVRIAVLALGANLQSPSPAEELANIPHLEKLGPAKLLEIREVPGREPKQAANVDFKFKLPTGLQKIAVGLVQPPDGQPVPTLHVEYFALTGPMDTRPPMQKKLLACSPDKPQAEQTREVLARFVTRAYRRPATPEEVERAAKIADDVVAGGQSWEAAIQLAMQAVLVSPKFLFRLELDDRPTAPEPRPLDEYQLASRLSYFLWNSMPDDELFRLAAAGELRRNLEPQVRRMLADPRSRSLYDSFAVQWLQLGRLNAAAPDKTLFPPFDDRLRQDMLKETELFFLTIIQEDRSLLDLLDANYTFMNQRLGQLYRVTDTKGNRLGQKKPMPGGQRLQGETFHRVELADGERGGLLTMASVLTVTSNPTRTSPVKRGKWVLEQLLGTPPPPPPANVPELDDAKAMLTGSLRQRMEQHRQNPACAGCHARMDPLGFAFENYDAIGRFRDKDGEFTIDPSGTLPDGKTFQGPQELKQILRDKRDLFARCVTEKLLVYALGRGLEYYDKPTVTKITQALAADDYKFSRLVLEIAHSDPFQLRRGLEQNP